MLLALGAAAVGLTSTATLVVPPIALGVAVAMLLAGYRHWWGAVLPAVYPLVSGAVVASASGGGEFGEVAFTSAEAFHHVVGTGLWGALGLVALLLAPQVARRGPGRMVAAAGSLAALVVMAPGMPELMIGGRWFWAPEAVRFASGPTWKYSNTALVQARWIDRAFDGPGTVLAPWKVMRAIALCTTKIHAVDPRTFSLSSLSEPPAVHAARIALSASMRNGHTPPPATLERDVDLVDVGYVCLDEPKQKTAAALSALGWTVHATGYGLTCYLGAG